MGVVGASHPTTTAEMCSRGLKITFRCPRSISIGHRKSGQSIVCQQGNLLRGEPAIRSRRVEGQPTPLAPATTTRLEGPIRSTVVAIRSRIDRMWKQSGVNSLLLDARPPRIAPLVLGFVWARALLVTLPRRSRCRSRAVPISTPTLAQPRPKADRAHLQCTRGARFANERSSWRSRPQGSTPPICGRARAFRCHLSSIPRSVDSGIQSVDRPIGPSITCRIIVGYASSSASDPVQPRAVRM